MFANDLTNFTLFSHHLRMPMICKCLVYTSFCLILVSYSLTNSIRNWELVRLCRRFMSMTGISGRIQNCLCTPLDEHLTHQGNKAPWLVVCGTTKTCIDCSSAPQNSSKLLKAPHLLWTSVFRQNIYFILHISTCMDPWYVFRRCHSRNNQQWQWHGNGTVVQKAHFIAWRL